MGSPWSTGKAYRVECNIEPCDEKEPGKKGWGNSPVEEIKVIQDKEEEGTYILKVQCRAKCNYVRIWDEESNVWVDDGRRMQDATAKLGTDYGSVFGTLLEPEWHEIKYKSKTGTINRVNIGWEE